MLYILQKRIILKKCTYYIKISNIYTNINKCAILRKFLINLYFYIYWEISENKWKKEKNFLDQCS